MKALDLWLGEFPDIAHLRPGRTLIDWPHKRHEANIGFETAMEQLCALECSAPLMRMRMLMVQEPQALFQGARL
ncbi:MULTISPECIES: hypothetical protein [unclassified Pseudomonas]|uniref:hypothetical protein n=1 Tax=unclassified Pseudomonas TaxID=196821 RepID=UPI000B81C628|nr:MULTISPECIES: hypothetical protein [unclassified Pseudomonas]